MFGSRLGSGLRFISVSVYVLFLMAKLSDVLEIGCG